MGIKARIARSGYFSDDKLFPPANSFEQTGECHLWRAVIDRALVDALSDREEYRNEAWSFFADDYEGFTSICRAANLDPNLVKNLLKEFLTLDAEQRNITRQDFADSFNVELEEPDI